MKLDPFSWLVAHGNEELDFDLGLQHHVVHHEFPWKQKWVTVGCAAVVIPDSASRGSSYLPRPAAGCSSFALAFAVTNHTTKRQHIIIIIIIIITIILYMTCCGIL